MSGAIWSVKRYKLSKYNYSSLSSKIISWVKQHKGRIRHSHQPKLLRRYSEDFYRIEVPGIIPMFVHSKPSNLKIYHEDGLLYVYINKEDFPEKFRDIHDSVIIPYVELYGGVIIEEPLQILDLDLRPWLKRQFSSESVHDIFVQSLKDGNIVSSPLLTAQSQDSPKVASIRLDKEIESVQTSSEEVSVPSGVTIKVKRARTIDHTVDIDWNTSGSVNIDSGFKPIMSVSIRGEIAQSQGRSYHESETLEYEVALSGEISTRYKLIWTDLWRKGLAEFRIGNNTQSIPFRFREWTKLEVHPI